MRFIIELDGPVFDVSASWFAAHQSAAVEVGWSKLDRATFWRLIRTQGRAVEVLPGAKPVKHAEYRAKFDHHAESDVAIGAYAAPENVGAVLGELAVQGACAGVTLGTNLAARMNALERAGLRGCLTQVERLDADPRRRPAELRLLAGGDPRTLVVGCSDTLVRAGGSVELLTVGLTCGPSVAARLHQAGAGVVYADLSVLAASLRTGAADLIRAGLLPPSFG